VRFISLLNIQGMENNICMGTFAVVSVQALIRAVIASSIYILEADTELGLVPRLPEIYPTYIISMP